MPDQADVRRLALSLPEAVELPHFYRTSFRVRGKIFATLRGAEPAVNLALPPELALEVLDSDPAAVAPVVWGSIKGWVTVDLRAVRPELLGRLIPAAWGRVAPKSLLPPSPV